MVRLVFLLGPGFLIILGMQDIQEQQETLKKSLVPPIKPIAKNITVVVRKAKRTVD